MMIHVMICIIISNHVLVNSIEDMYGDRMLLLA
jgi:hypothetical protein